MFTTTGSRGCPEQQVWAERNAQGVATRGPGQEPMIPEGPSAVPKEQEPASLPHGERRVFLTVQNLLNIVYSEVR